MTARYMSRARPNRYSLRSGELPFDEHMHNPQHATSTTLLIADAVGLFGFPNPPHGAASRLLSMLASGLELRRGDMVIVRCAPGDAFESASLMPGCRLVIDPCRSAWNLLEEWTDDRILIRFDRVVIAAPPDYRVTGRLVCLAQRGVRCKLVSGPKHRRSRSAVGPDLSDVRRSLAADEAA